MPRYNNVNARWHASSGGNPDTISVFQGSTLLKKLEFDQRTSKNILTGEIAATRWLQVMCSLPEDMAITHHGDTPWDVRERIRQAEIRERLAQEQGAPVICSVEWTIRGSKRVGLLFGTDRRFIAEVSFQPSVTRNQIETDLRSRYPQIGQSSHIAHLGNQMHKPS